MIPVHLKLLNTGHRTFVNKGEYCLRHIEIDEYFNEKIPQCSHWTYFFFSTCSHLKHQTCSVQASPAALICMCVPTNIIIAEYTKFVPQFLHSFRINIHKTNEQMSNVYFCYLNGCSTNHSSTIDSRCANKTWCSFAKIKVPMFKIRNACMIIGTLNYKT